jgi:hypothetical protein
LSSGSTPAKTPNALAQGARALAVALEPRADADGGTAGMTPAVEVSLLHIIE